MLHATHSATGWGQRERENCVVYFIRIAQITRHKLPQCDYWQALRRLRAQTATATQTSIRTPTRLRFRHSRRMFWRSTFQIRDRNATSANTRDDDSDGNGDGDHWRWPSNVSTASAVMLMSRQQRDCGAAAPPAPPPTSSTTAITSRGTVAADTYKTSQVDGGVVHPWREQTTN